MGDRSCFPDDPCFQPGCVYCDFALPEQDDPECYDQATDACRERVRQMLHRAHVPSGRAAVRSFINSAGPNLLCLDCGYENHTRGHQLCNCEAPASSQEPPSS